MRLIQEITKVTGELLTHQELLNAISENAPLTLEHASLKKIVDSLYGRLEFLIDLYETSKERSSYLEKDRTQKLLNELSMLSDRNLRPLLKPFLPAMHLRKSRFKKKIIYLILIY